MTKTKKRKDPWAKQETPSTVTWWYREGHFASDEQARGAFELAYQQWYDGIGTVSLEEWMGMTEAELREWMRTGGVKLP